jgi:hypothetical protein
VSIMPELIGVGPHQKKIAFILQMKKKPMTICELGQAVYGYPIKVGSTQYHSIARSLEQMRKKELVTGVRPDVQWSLTELGEKI